MRCALCHLCYHRGARPESRLTSRHDGVRRRGDGPAHALRQRADGLGGDRRGRRDGDPVVLVGPLVHLEERERARVIGTWVDDSRYGLQVKVSEARPLPPADAETLIAYLRRVKHVGAKRAPRLVDAVRRRAACSTRSTATRRRRSRPSGCGGGARAGGGRSWHELRVTRQLHLLLAPHGLAYLVKRIHERVRPTAHRVVSEQPVRADERVRRRLPDRRPDRPRRRRRRSTPRRGRAPARCTCSPRRSAAAARACRIDALPPALARAARSAGRAGR